MSAGAATRVERLRQLFAARLAVIQQESDTRRLAIQQLTERLRSVEAESDARLSQTRLLQAQLTAAWATAEAQREVLRAMQRQVALDATPVESMPPDEEDV